MHRQAKYDNTLWVDIFFEVKKWQGEVVNNEPDKHASVDWFDPKALPDTIIPSLRSSFQAIADGETLLEFGWDDDPDGSSR